MQRRQQSRSSFASEALESRLLLDATGLGSLAQPELEAVPRIVAGDPNGTPADSPSNRVTTDFAGVGSIQLVKRRRAYICTGTLIDPEHVLTAGHCVDTNDNGTNDFSPSNITYFIDGNTSNGVTASSVFVHPDYTGFNRPSINDDLTILKLSRPVTAAEATPYPVLETAVSQGTTFEMVGFGQSGDGVNGYYVNASFSTKRLGYNNADVFFADDEGSGTSERWEADFDAPNGSNGSYGGSSLGNDVEANIGGGDSGGPSFVDVGGTKYLAATNTYGRGSSGTFGTFLGGMLLNPYTGWISDVLAGNAGGGGGGGNGNGNGRGGGKKSAEAGDQTAFDGFAQKVDLFAAPADDASVSLVAGRTDSPRTVAIETIGSTTSADSKVSPETVGEETAPDVFSTDLTILFDSL